MRDSPRRRPTTRSFSAAERSTQTMWEAEQAVIAVAAAAENLDADRIVLDEFRATLKIAEGNGCSPSRHGAGRKRPWPRPEPEISADEIKPKPEASLCAAATVTEKKPRPSRRGLEKARGGRYRAKVEKLAGRGGARLGSFKSSRRSKKDKEAECLAYENHLFNIFQNYTDEELDEIIAQIEEDNDLYAASVNNPVIVSPKSPDRSQEPLGKFFSSMTRQTMTAINNSSQLADHGYFGNPDIPEDFNFHVIEPSDPLPVVKTELEETTAGFAELSISSDNNRSISSDHQNSVLPCSVKVEPEEDLAELSVNPFDQTFDAGFWLGLDKYLYTLEQDAKESMLDPNEVLRDHDYPFLNFAVSYGHSNRSL